MRFRGAGYDSLAGRQRVELIAKRNLDETVGIECGFVEGIDGAVDIGEVCIAAFSGDGVVDGAGADDRLVEVGGMAGTLELVISELGVVSVVAGLGLLLLGGVDSLLGLRILLIHVVDGLRLLLLCREDLLAGLILLLVALEADFPHLGWQDTSRPFFRGDMC